MQTTPVIPTYPFDMALLSELPAERRAAFDKYMTELDAEHVKHGSPYGDGSLWDSTGAACWYAYFDDDYSAVDAMDEDLSND
jgi:hypothetical protein